MRKTAELIKAINELRMQVAELQCKPKYKAGDQVLVMCDWIGAKEIDQERVTVIGLKEILVTEHEPWPFFGLKEYRAVAVYDVDTFCGNRKVKEWQLQ